MDIAIRPMTEADRMTAKRICHTAFGTFLGAPDPENFWMDRDYVYGRFGAEQVAGFVAEADGEVVGSNFATQWGSVGFFGPLTIRPDLWNSGLGQRLVDAACDVFAAWGIRHAGLFTFADSAKHVWTYGKFGFHPRFLTAIMAAPARAGSAARWSRYGDLPERQRAAVESAAHDSGLTQLGADPASVRLSQRVKGRVLVSCLADRDGEAVDGEIELRPDEGLVIALA